MHLIKIFFFRKEAQRRKECSIIVNPLRRRVIFASLREKPYRFITAIKKSKNDTILDPLRIA